MPVPAFPPLSLQCMLSIGESPICLPQADPGHTSKAVTYSHTPPVRDTCNSVYHQLDVQTCEVLQLGSIIWAVGGGRCSSVLSRWLSLGGRTHWRKVEVGTHWRKVNGRTRHEPPPSSPSRPSPGHPTTWIATMSGFSWGGGRPPSARPWTSAWTKRQWGGSPPWRGASQRFRWRWGRAWRRCRWWKRTQRGRAPCRGEQKK